MTGHGNVTFSAQERENLRTYLNHGGFLHIDDNYGMDPFVRREIQQLYPDKVLKPVPVNHPIYTTFYSFPKAYLKFMSMMESPLRHLEFLLRASWCYCIPMRPILVTVGKMLMCTEIVRTPSKSAENGGQYFGICLDGRLLSQANFLLPSNDLSRSSFS